jgi:hypothetical protein
MKFCDTTENILEWSSEEIAIKYFSPIDKRYHRYFVDFWIKIQEKNGEIKCKMVEIKPFKQTQQPKQPKRQTKSYLSEVKAWVINNHKWKAAESYCKSRNWDFLVLTEKHIFKQDDENLKNI